MLIGKDYEIQFISNVIESLNCPNITDMLTFKINEEYAGYFYMDNDCKCYVTNKEIRKGSFYIYWDVLNNENIIIQCMEISDTQSSFVKSVTNGEIIHIPFCDNHDYVFDRLIPLKCHFIINDP